MHPKLAKKKTSKIATSRKCRSAALSTLIAVFSLSHPWRFYGERPPAIFVIRTLDKLLPYPKMPWKRYRSRGIGSKRRFRIGSARGVIISEKKITAAISRAPRDSWVSLLLLRFHRKEGDYAGSFFFHPGLLPCRNITKALFPIDCIYFRRLHFYSIRYVSTREHVRTRKHFRGLHLFSTQFSLVICDLSFLMKIQPTFESRKNFVALS